MGLRRGRGEEIILIIQQGFPKSGKGWWGGEGSEILLGEIFLPAEGNLRRSDFDNSNLFQS